MAEKLLRLYKHINDVGGLQAKMKLAQATKIPSNKAATAPDSDENVNAFRKAIKDITGQDAPEV